MLLCCQWSTMLYEMKRYQTLLGIFQSQHTLDEEKENGANSKQQMNKGTWLRDSRSCDWRRVALEIRGRCLKLLGTSYYTEISDVSSSINVSIFRHKSLFNLSRLAIIPFLWQNSPEIVLLQQIFFSVKETDFFHRNVSIFSCSVCNPPAFQWKILGSWFASPYSVTCWCLIWV